MKMIPNIFYNYSSHKEAEMKVFKALKEIDFIEGPSYAFHSILIPNHINRYKFVGESDFLFLSKYGLFILEVKGGGISVSDGKWYSTDRNNQRHQLKEPPFHQAEENLFSIIRDINLGFYSPTAYGVVFPDTIWNNRITSIEFNRDTICDKNDLMVFGIWLKNFLSHYSNNSDKYLIEKEIEEIKNKLRPNFDFALDMRNKLTLLEEQRLVLTEKQFNYLDIAMQIPRICVEGGAGTGKTILAIELARRFAMSNKKVSLICKSNWLRHSLSSDISLKNVFVSTFDSLKLDMLTNNIEFYDVMIIDEAQDLQISDIDVLENSLLNGLEKGIWYAFLDKQNQSLVFIDDNDTGVEFLLSFRSNNINLNKNLRNTKQIVSRVKDILNFPSIEKSDIHGPEVKELYFKDGAELNNVIKDLLDSGAEKNEITILSPNTFRESAIYKLLPTTTLKKIKELDEYSMRHLPISDISFAEIKNFKGLENNIIILADIDKPKGDMSIKFRNSLYVGMTRAKSLLIMAYQK
ncbi:MAG: NERD domain-containing protein [Melioribacteraceae bacterium]|nr:NERD domain-containing protein [Melioribacteraceae bacterium]